MKKFLDGLMEWKTQATFMFSGSVILYSIIALFFGRSEISIVMIISLLVVSMMGTFIQFVAFSNHFIKGMRYSLRLLVFIVPFAIMLIVNALCFEWFPKEIREEWIVFTGIFILVFVIMTIGFEIYFKITGKKYEGLLGQYRQKRKEILDDESTKLTD